ncbi:hypothetical protein B0T22DRAFT_491279 [Podospora appendiculata]|uniref:Uncharacterized protein n=1 Tax=Podospora appendiculata TaxID=314037 RepID=A0AAE0XCR4_9PEZI|nr:hypothetical protein B0T22DRAFT_491279 [Podospora appendiculata]
MARARNKRKKDPKPKPANHPDAGQQDKNMKTVKQGKVTKATAKKQERNKRKRQNRAQRLAAANLADELAGLSVAAEPAREENARPAVPAQSSTIEPQAPPQLVPRRFPCLECLASAVKGKESDGGHGCFRARGTPDFERCYRCLGRNDVCTPLEFAGVLLRYSSEFMASFAKEHNSGIPGDKKERSQLRQFLDIPVQVAIHKKQREAAREKADAETAEIREALNRLQT